MYGVNPIFNEDGSLSQNSIFHTYFGMNTNDTKKPANPQNMPFSSSAFYNWLLSNAEQNKIFSSFSPQSIPPYIPQYYSAPLYSCPPIPATGSTIPSHSAMLSTSTSGVIPTSSNSLSSSIQDTMSQDTLNMMNQKTNTSSLKRSEDYTVEISKKRRRQEQNRVSARESRRKRKEYVSCMETKLKELEEENQRLRSVINNSIPYDNPEHSKQRAAILQQMQKLFLEGGSTEELVNIVRLFRSRCSYNDVETKDELNFYMEKLYSYIMPSQTVSFCLYILLNNMKTRVTSINASKTISKVDDLCDKTSLLSTSTSELTSNQSLLNKKAVTPETTPLENSVVKSQVDSSSSDSNKNSETSSKNVKEDEKSDMHEKDSKEPKDGALWRLLVKELELTSDQEEKILGTYDKLLSIINKFHSTASMMEQLNEALKDKNNSLDAYIDELQDILTPLQVVKYVLWIRCYTNNESLSTFMHSNKIDQIQKMIKSGDNEDLKCVSERIE